MFLVLVAIEDGVIPCSITNEGSLEAITEADVLQQKP